MQVTVFSKWSPEVELVGAAAVTRGEHTVVVVDAALSAREQAYEVAKVLDRDQFHVARWEFVAPTPVAWMPVAVTA